jgi:tRNA (guanine-N7-)-methyltransferase
VAEGKFEFRSERGRSEFNPYVEKINEFAPYTVHAEGSSSFKGQWREEIGTTGPLILEIGPGNGFFFREACERFSDAGLVGLEIRFKRVWLTANKARLAGLTNFRVVHHHSGYLGDVFAPDELDCVVINHPDPWPKDRHHKHRLLQPSFGALLAELVKPGGEVWVQSDFTPYGPLAQDVFGTEAWSNIAYTDDLHGDDQQLLAHPPACRFWAADIETNYEKKSRKKGETIVLAGYRRT